MKKFIKKAAALIVCAALAAVPVYNAGAEGIAVSDIAVTTSIGGGNIAQLTAGDSFAVRDAIYSLSDTSINRMTSEHFQIIWGNGDTTGTVTNAFVKGNLINLENIRSFYINELGMKDITTSQNPYIKGQYKTNVYISDTGLTKFESDWAYMATDADSFAYLFVTPAAMRVDEPSWVLPHELAHVFTYHQGGSIDYAWYESTANWFRDQYLGSEYYAYGGRIYGPTSDFFAPYLINSSYYVPHMLQWYDTWPLFLYITENPDNIDGLGLELMHKILENTQKDESMYATIERLSGVPIKTVLGGMTKRLATLDFSRQEHYLKHLNEETLTIGGNYAKIYTTLEAADGEGYQAVPSDRAPMQTGFNIIPLTFDGTKDVIKAELVNTSGIDGSDFCASLVTETADHTTRYSQMFGEGEGSVELYGDETAAYLVVCAVPDHLKGYDVNWDSKETDTDTRYSYKVKINCEDNTYPMGDVDLDGKLTEEDATLLLAFASGIAEPANETALKNADLNGSGAPDITDVIYLLKLITPTEQTSEETTEQTTISPVNTALSATAYSANTILSDTSRFNVVNNIATNPKQIKINENGYVEFCVNDGATVTVSFKCGSSQAEKSASISLCDKTSQTLSGGAGSGELTAALDSGCYRITASQTGDTTAQILSITVTYK